MAAEGQNGFIHSLNGNELVADADDHNPSTQHRCFKPAEDPPILTHGVRTHHAIEQLLTMPAKDISDHRSFPFGCGLIHSIHGLGEFGLHEAQILIRGGIRQCQHDTHGQCRHNQAQTQKTHTGPKLLLNQCRDGIDGNGGAQLPFDKQQTDD